MTQEQSAHSGIEDERIRRDALARNLCARICSELRTVDELDRVHRALSYAEQCVDLVEWLRKQKYDLTEQASLGDAERDRYCRAWNGAVDHVIRGIEARR